MASPDRLEFERLLQPISDEAPAGDEFRVADRNTYAEIRRMRDLLTKSEKTGEPVEDEDAKWESVLRMSEQALTDVSKDYTIAAWLLESLVRLHGFSGLRDGVRLIRELTTRFWDTVHPRPDEDGLETTMQPLAGLDATLPGPLSNIPITLGTSNGPFALWQFRQTADLERLEPDRQQQRISEGWVSSEMFEKSVAETPPDFFRDLVEDLSQCEDEVLAMDRLLEEQCGTNDDGYPLAPSFSHLRETLAESMLAVRGIAKDIIGLDDDHDDGEASDGDSRASGQAVFSGDVRTREEAFDVLLQVSRFFKRTEPHSPVSYALEQVVRWGRMSLPELLSELIEDSNTRDSLFRQVGLRKPDDND